MNDDNDFNPMIFFTAGAVAGCTDVISFAEARMRLGRYGSPSGGGGNGKPGAVIDLSSRRARPATGFA